MSSRRFGGSRPVRPMPQNDAPQGPPRRRGRRWTKRAGNRPGEEARVTERESLHGGKARGHINTRDLDQFLEGWVDDAVEGEEGAEPEEDAGSESGS